jgi:hypothetical protein
MLAKCGRYYYHVAQERNGRLPSILQASLRRSWKTSASVGWLVPSESTQLRHKENVCTGMPHGQWCVGCISPRICPSLALPYPAIASESCPTDWVRCKKGGSLCRLGVAVLAVVSLLSRNVVSTPTDNVDAYTYVCVIGPSSLTGRVTGSYDSVYGTSLDARQPRESKSRGGCLPTLAISSRLRLPVRSIERSRTE